MSPSLPPGTPAHIVLVIDENQSFQNVIGSADAPFVNSLAAQGTLFTNYFAIGHPSQPNYLALFCGSTQGVTDDSTSIFRRRHHWQVSCNKPATASPGTPNPAPRPPITMSG